MTALSANAANPIGALRQKEAMRQYSLQVVSAGTIWQGSLVSQVSQTTGCKAAVDEANGWFVGLAQRKVVNATSGTSRCEMVTGCEAYLLSSNILVTSIGVSAEVVDSSLVDLAAGTSHHVEVGRIVEYIDSTHTWVWLGQNKGVIAT